MNNEDKFLPIKKGLLELVVLNVIKSHQVYAADILAQLKDTEFATQDGTLYPMLSRFRREGMVAYEWVESEAGPPRKYYRLTAKGRDQLKTMMKYWEGLISTIKKLS